MAPIIIPPAPVGAADPAATGISTTPPPLPGRMLSPIDVRWLPPPANLPHASGVVSFLLSREQTAPQFDNRNLVSEPATHWPDAYALKRDFSRQAKRAGSWDCLCGKLSMR